MIADCDLRASLHRKRLFDAVGHYGREDALAAPVPVAEPAGEVDGESPPDLPIRQRGSSTTTGISRSVRAW